MICPSGRTRLAILARHEPLINLRDALLQTDRGLPPKASKPRAVHQLAHGAIGLRTIVFNAAGKPDDAGHQPGELGDRNFAA